MGVVVCIHVYFVLPGYKSKKRKNRQKLTWWFEQDIQQHKSSEDCKVMIKSTLIVCCTQVCWISIKQEIGSSDWHLAVWIAFAAKLQATRVAEDRRKRKEFSELKQQMETDLKVGKIRKYREWVLIAIVEIILYVKWKCLIVIANTCIHNGRGEQINVRKRKKKTW